MSIKTVVFNGKVLPKLFAVLALSLQCVCINTSISATTTSNDIFYFEVKENSPPNTFVGKIATKSGFTYRFNEDPAEFALDPKSGVIVTTQVPTDRETKNFYNLVILSSSPIYPLEVKIKIIDVNDNTPHWPSYINTNLSFSESAPIGTKVILDTAIDPDEGYLRYQINDNNRNIYNTNAMPFKLNYNTSSAFLHLEVSDVLDRETQSTYVVNISAIDSGLKSSSVLFNVKILDSNDNPPIFDHSDYSVSLNESVGKDVSILQVRATDADEEGNDNSRISYYLLSNEFFYIDPNTGIIFTAQEGPINCGTVTAEDNDDYSRVCVFTVFAHDYGTPRQDGRTYVTAKIQGSNNHSPVIKFRYFSGSDQVIVDESAANGSVVAAVSVVDLDHGLNGMTTLDIANGDELGHFRLDSIGNSHIIRVNGTLDREKASSYNLTIRAYDKGTPIRSSSAYLNIIVYESNETSSKFSAIQLKSIGVILVITFFIILILVISTSFLIFHNQKKNHLRECNTSQRKMTATIKPYLSATPSPPSTLAPQLPPPPQLPSLPIAQQPSLPTQTSSPTHNMPTRLPTKQPDVVSPIAVPPTEVLRPVPPAVPNSIIHSHSDNYNDSYSNILANGEHYDLENMSSIAPSDIDIVYHYKGFRNRDSQPLHHRHAPLARLSPSVSELSSMPRILTLQDLSPPQVPPCPPPVNTRTGKAKPSDKHNKEDNNEEEDDDNNTDDSFTCSEFNENYELNKKDKNMIFQRVW
ncbi:cadherin-related tumor suppressor-like [Oppia nitens]|uniref:cadherin-related tumor suppressor-like n=1 Tax=Oppia nitens TaxID=1686743 RepID=UPI0023DBB75E|nr:cadherin-related tumor suppressor-like [Oppia nitens]